MEYKELTPEEYADLEGRVLYEDNHILIVNKNSGEIVQGDKTGDETIADSYKAFVAMRDNKPGKVFMGVTHRLDRPVSGVTVLAKTSKALSRMDELFREGKVHKFYWALVCDRPQEESGLLENWLVRNEKQNKSYVVKPPVSSRNTDKHSKGSAGDAKLAKLKYRLLGSTQRCHLLEVELLTGRHHQIRCQLAAMGCVIKGDLKYGSPRSNPDGGICLHARRISFEHPVRHVEVTVEAPWPASWKGVESIPGLF